ncbi:MAG TPA: MBL fold metallo-hydrolase [Gammaproteobacteria bacterium]|jgi:glyoxylase-like metal-dependent hydrolase (beta-lactamase superfamily II)|nr:MBL fold metallo-hydrolase [Chromatiales bacterium]MCP4925105.1 MBL fold metallo-hydrolase [Gammaproteobacteria bacterium]MDP7297016.1 MBL fold metallo-hydrolase [Gammaproteobacteria bacterium]MDP7661469.1 MBL fold metallo-hydrolase [Gammaproteobacteria bacterium]HJP38743.1 MBL fold metallo-hydrolase [Gammaproteobacteria bacterium]
MQRWQIGDVNITRIIETEDTSMAAEIMLPEATPANVLPIEWLKPHFIDADGNLIASIFSLLIESQGKKIVVDTCLGNDKQRTVPEWHERQGAFLDEIAHAGFPREAVDIVACTHLHPDHVGWNTMLIDGEWRPTFPGARYLFSSLDWDWLDQQPVTPLGDYCGDSVRPVFAADQADLIVPDHQITEEVWLESTPGHSPGHVSVRISSQNQHAIITGDLIHHPCQMARPRWCSTFDFDRQQALQTREYFLQKFCGEPVLVIGSHFSTPTAGHIVADGDAYRFDTE